MVRDEAGGSDALATARRISRMIGFALLVGVVMLTAVGAVVGGGGQGTVPVPAPSNATPVPPGFLGIDPAHELLFLIGCGLALTAIPLSFVLRGAMMPRSSVELRIAAPAGITAFLIGMAMCEAPGLFGGVLVLLSGQVMPPVLIVGVSVLAMLVHMAMPLVRMERDPNVTAYNVGR